MTGEEMDIVDAMAKYGGSFIQCLAECFYHADRENIEKLKAAFPEYLEEYKKFIKK